QKQSVLVSSKQSIVESNRTNSHSSVAARADDPAETARKTDRLRCFCDERVWIPQSLGWVCCRSDREVIARALLLEPFLLPEKRDERAIGTSRGTRSSPYVALKTVVSSSPSPTAAERDQIAGQVELNLTRFQ